MRKTVKNLEYKDNMAKKMKYNLPTNAVVTQTASSSMGPRVMGGVPPRQRGPSSGMGPRMLGGMPSRPRGTSSGMGPGMQGGMPSRPRGFSSNLPNRGEGMLPTPWLENMRFNKPS